VDSPTPTAPPTPKDTPSATATGAGEPTAVDTATPTATPSAQASELAATIEGGEVRLAWKSPAPASGFTEARLLRRLNAPPAGPGDPAAETIYSGTGDTAVDAVEELLPDVETIAGEPAERREYFYTVYACTPSGLCEANGSSASLRPTLVEVLRAGGYTIHWRHASADVCSDRLDLGPASTTMVPDWWRSCDDVCATATARQLNDTGRMEAASIGAFFEARGIAIGRVLSSEFCRNFTTAELMDFAPPIELRREVTYFVYGEAGRCAASFALIGEVPAPGSNTAIIGHAGFPPGCELLNSLAWSEAAVFKPDGTGAALLVARVRAAEWESLP
jgi:phosphohistidine phosphatase SixA